MSKPKIGILVPKTLRERILSPEDLEKMQSFADVEIIPGDENLSEDEAADFLAGKDGLAKTFLDQVGPMQMIWIQFTATFLIVSSFAAPAMGRKILQPTPLAGQFVRGALNGSAVAMLYWGLSYIPLADAIAMFVLAY